MSEPLDPYPYQQLHRVFDGGETARPLALLVARYTLDYLETNFPAELPDGFTLKAYPAAVTMLADAWLKAMRELYSTDERARDDAALVAYGAERDRWTAAYVECVEGGLDPFAELGECPPAPLPAYLSADETGRATLDQRLENWLITARSRRAPSRRDLKNGGFDATRDLLDDILSKLKKAPVEPRAWSFTYLDPATDERHLLDPPADLVTDQGEIIDNGEPEPDEQLDLGLFEVPSPADLEALLADSNRVTSWALGEEVPPEAYAHLPAELRARLVNRPTRKPALIALNPSLLRAARFATVARCAWAVSVKEQLHGLAAALTFAIDRLVTATFANLTNADATADHTLPARARTVTLTHRTSGLAFASLNAGGGGAATLDDDAFRTDHLEAWLRLVKDTVARRAGIVPLLDPMIHLFGQRGTELWNSLTTAKRRTYLEGAVFPALRFKGFTGLGEELGITRTNELSTALEMLRTLTLPRLPDGSLFPQLLHYTDNRATGELLVYLHAPMLPHAAKQLDLTDKRLVPSVKLPRFDTLPTQYKARGTAAARDLIAAMRDRNTEQLDHAGWRFTEADLFELLHNRLGPSATKGAAPPAEKWLEAWLEELLTGDSSASPTLERLAPDLYHLHRDHAGARRMLFQAAKRSRLEAERGRKSGIARREKRDAPKPPKPPKA
jgi:hypothetical protein